VPQYRRAGRSEQVGQFLIGSVIGICGAWRPMASRRGRRRWPAATKGWWRRTRSLRTAAGPDLAPGEGGSLWGGRAGWEPNRLPVQLAEGPHCKEPGCDRVGESILHGPPPVTRPPRHSVLLSTLGSVHAYMPTNEAT
jgi:hypothetical protein